VPAGILLAAASARTLAWAAHGAAFAGAFIAVELACAAVLAIASQRLDAASVAA
jgi:hypothetical protein